jgi:hypothetical protein
VTSVDAGLAPVPPSRPITSWSGTDRPSSTSRSRTRQTGQTDALVGLRGTDLEVGACVDTAVVGSPFAFLLGGGEGELLLLRADEDGDNPDLQLRDARAGARWEARLQLPAGPPGTLAERLSAELGPETVVAARRVGPQEETELPALVSVDRGDGAVQLELGGTSSRSRRGSTRAGRSAGRSPPSASAPCWSTAGRTRWMRPELAGRGPHRRRAGAARPRLRRAVSTVDGVGPLARAAVDVDGGAEGGAAGDRYVVATGTPDTEAETVTLLDVRLGRRRRSARRRCPLRLVGRRGPRRGPGLADPPVARRRCPEPHHPRRRTVPRRDHDLGRPRRRARRPRDGGEAVLLVTARPAEPRYRRTTASGAPRVRQARRGPRRGAAAAARVPPAHPRLRGRAAPRRRDRDPVGGHRRGPHHPAPRPARARAAARGPRRDLHHHPDPPARLRRPVRAVLPRSARRPRRHPRRHRRTGGGGAGRPRRVPARPHRPAHGGRGRVDPPVRARGGGPVRSRRGTRRRGVLLPVQGLPRRRPRPDPARPALAQGRGRGARSARCRSGSGATSSRPACAPSSRRSSPRSVVGPPPSGASTRSPTG